MKKNWTFLSSELCVWKNKQWWLACLTRRLAGFPGSVCFDRRTKTRRAATDIPQVCPAAVKPVRVTSTPTTRRHTHTCPCASSSWFFCKIKACAKVTERTERSAGWTECLSEMHWAKQSCQGREGTRSSGFATVAGVCRGARVSTCLPSFIFPSADFTGSRQCWE